jgi:hypothetical protein
MYACCANCQSSTWIEAARPTGELRTVACGECAQSFVLQPEPELGNTSAEHYRAMVRLAKAGEVDMPLAYSVLLGLMPLAQAKAIQRSRAQAPPRPARESETFPENLDPGFHRSVREGSLTVHQALSRGSRDAFAAALVKRHDLASAVAFEVADNRISLRKAIRRVKDAREAERRQAAPPKMTGGVPALRKLAVVGVATLSLATVSGFAWSWNVSQRHPAVVSRAARTAAVTPTPAVAETTPAQQKARALSRATRVRANDEGELIQVVGPDPGSVLSSYCKAVSGFLGVEPLHVRATVPTFRDARLGVFQDYENGGVPRAIRIRRDAKSGQWVAGSGKAPIQTTDASELPPDDAAVNVAKR